MNVTFIMSTIVMVLVLYAVCRSWLFSRKKKKTKVGWAHKIKHIMELHFSDKIQFFATVLSICLVVYFFGARTEEVVAIFSIPGLIIYVLIILSCLGTVWNIVQSKDEAQLNEQEAESLIILGILTSIIGLVRAVGFEEQYSANQSSLFECILLVVEYSVYSFFVGALGSVPLKDCANCMIRLAQSHSHDFRSFENSVRNNAIPHKLAHLYSEKKYFLIKEEKGCKKFLNIIYVILTVPIDLIRYLLHYSLCLILWLPAFCFVESGAMICRLFLKLARCVYALSDRRVAVISFRSAIATAMLIVVIMNRYELISTADETTSVLEFIASVVIIPIVLGWIQDVWHKDNGTGNS